MQTDTHSDESHTDDVQADESLGTRAEIKELGGCKRHMKASVPVDKVVEELDRNYEDLAKTVQIPGFRKGRVPRPLLESRYGEEVESEVKESIVAASFSEVIEENELQVFSSPKFENVTFDAGSDLTYEVEFEVRPDFELPGYKGVEVALDTPEFSEDDVTTELEKIQRQLATIEPTKPEAIGEDGYLGGSYTLFIDDNEVKRAEKITFQPSTGVLEHFYIEDLSKRIADRDWSSEAPMVFEVTVPEQYPDEVLRGKEARLELVVSDGYDLKLPELDDELAKKADHESLEELQAEVRETLQKRKAREGERLIEDAILDKLAALTEFEVPEALVDAQIRRNRANQEQVLLEQGFTPDQVQQFFAESSDTEASDTEASDTESSDTESSDTESSDTAASDTAASDTAASDTAAAAGEEESADARMTDEIRQTAKKYFILEAIAEKEKIFVTEQHIEEKIVHMAQHHGMPPAKLRAELENSGRLTELRQSLKHDKVREFLRSKAKFVTAETAGNEATEASDSGGGSAGSSAGSSETVDET